MIRFVLFTAIALASSQLFAQDLRHATPRLDFARNGSSLIVRSAEGGELARVDLDKPAFKGKVVAFTYSAKKKPVGEKAANTLTLFPNPATQQISLKLKGDWKYPLDIQVFDKLGNAMLHSTLETAGQPLDVSLLLPGIYILKANSGHAAAVETLVVE